MERLEYPSWLQPSLSSMPPKDNLYIPKFILEVPWYYSVLDGFNNDAFGHQRKVPAEQFGHSDDDLKDKGTEDITKIKPIARGDSDYFVAKRDRWHGFKPEEWDEVFAKWDHIKKFKQTTQSVAEDSDDTDYELELQELGIARKEFQKGFVEDPIERSIRERNYTPAYILAINANEGGKIRLGKDSTSNLVNDDTEFVKSSCKDERELGQMQKFAWEQHKQYEEQKLRELYQKQLANLSNPSAEAVDSTVPVDLDLSVEASPTLMMMKTKKENEKKSEASEKRKQSLLNRYG